MSVIVVTIKEVGRVSPKTRKGIYVKAGESATLRTGEGSIYIKPSEYFLGGLYILKEDSNEKPV